MSEIVEAVDAVVSDPLLAADPNTEPNVIGEVTLQNDTLLDTATEIVTFSAQDVITGEANGNETEYTSMDIIDQNATTTIANNSTLLTTAVNGTDSSFFDQLLQGELGAAVTSGICVGLIILVALLVCLIFVAVDKMKKRNEEEE